MLTQEIIDYVKKHKGEDITKLLFAQKNQTIDIKLAVRIIDAKNRIKTKLPEWYENDDLFYPPTVSLEQSSSQTTATYKQLFVTGGTVLDLTGGMGIDSYYLSKVAEKVFYYERNSELCEIAKYNFSKLNATNIEVNHNNISEDSSFLIQADLIYIDPSRRDEEANRVFALQDYQPNIIDLKEYLFSKSEKILIKISPMADITACLNQLPETKEIHILSVDNECKELLFYLEKDVYYCNNQNLLKVVTVNFTKQNKADYFEFFLDSEKTTDVSYACTILDKYMYEPNSSVMKSGAFKCIGNYFNLDKIHQNTHLYTSTKLINKFPGRVFEIIDVYDFNKKGMSSITKVYNKANVSTRNFPISTDELKKRLSISDGGNIYIFGCIFIDNSKKLVVCTKAS